MTKLKNKNAIITGAAEGIGRSTAELLSSEGATILIVDINKKVSEVANKLRANYLCLDISQEASWKIITDYAKDMFLNLDILVNNAGITGLDIGDQTPENMLLKTWNKIHEVNANSVFLGCRHAINLMKNNPRNCSIVNVASRSGFVGVPNLAAYASSKASILNYTKSVALYCAQKNYNIRCNSVVPAAIMTRMWDHLIKTQEDKEKFASTIPLKKMGEAKDVAKAILYLASDDSAFTTGSEIIIDGGILAGSTASPTSK